MSNSVMKDGIRKVLLQRESKARGKPIYAYKVPYRDANGKQTSETFRSERQAKAFRDKVRAKKHEGLIFDPKSGRVSSGEYADQWLANKEAVKKSGTYSQYCSHIRNHAFPMFSGRRMNSFLPSDIQTWVTWLKAKQGLAPSTIETVYNIVASVFRTAVRDKVIAESPCQGIELPKKDKSKARPFTPAQVMAESWIGQRRRHPSGPCPCPTQSSQPLPNTSSGFPPYRRNWSGRMGARRKLL